MGTKNILNYLEKDGKTVHITVRIDKRLLLQIDMLLLQIGMLLLQI